MWERISKKDKRTICIMAGSFRDSSKISTRRDTAGSTVAEERTA